MDLPTYTNIWRIEKRLYKLYDFRLPFPVPLVTVGVCLGVALVWVLLMNLLGVPFQTPWHVVWIVPPWVIGFLATRPVVEGKRLTELLRSQALYATEARVYTRLAPQREPDRIVIAVRVWRRDPAAGPLPVGAVAGRGRAGKAAATEPVAEPEAVEAVETAVEPAAVEAVESAAPQQEARRSEPVAEPAPARPRPRSAGKRVLNYFGLAMDRPERAAAVREEVLARPDSRTPAAQRTELATAKRSDDAPSRRTAREEDADSWYPSLGESSGQTPWPPTAGAVHASAGAAAAEDVSEQNPSEVRADQDADTERDRAAARRRAEEIMAAPDPAEPDEAPEALAVDVPTQPFAAADLDDVRVRRTARRRLRGRTQGVAVTRHFERVRAENAEPRETARGYGDGLPATAEEARGERERAPERPRPHASPWDLPPVARTDEAGIPDQAEPADTPWGRTARDDAPDPVETPAPEPEAEPEAAPGHEPDERPEDIPARDAGHADAEPEPPAADGLRVEEAAPGPAEDRTGPEPAPAEAAESRFTADPTAPTGADRKPLMELDHGTGAWEQVADTLRGRVRDDVPRAPVGGDRPGREPSPEPDHETGTWERTTPARGVTDTGGALDERKPSLELDHGTGEHDSFTDAAERRPTEEDLAAVEQAALRRRGADLSTGEDRTGDHPGESGGPAAADSPEEPRPSDRLSRSMRSAGAETAAEPEAEPAPGQDRGVFTRIAQNARKVGEMLTPARGTTGEGRNRTEAEKPDLQLDHGTGEQQLLSGQGDVRVVGGPDGASAPTGVPEVAPGEVPAPEHHEVGTGPDEPAHTDDSPSGGTRGWRRLARVVTGGNIPSVRTQLPPADVERLRTPFEGARRIVVLGCTGSAGQTITALMLGHTLAAHRDERVVAIDVNPGPHGLSRRIRTESPETLTSLLANADSIHGYLGLRGYTSQSTSGLEVVATLDDPYVQTLDDRDYAGLTAMLERHYKITLLDPAATGVARALPIADSLVLVAPASSDAARAVALTFEWLDGHGYADLRTKSVLVVNGVSKRSLADVDAAEQVARGGCRAIVRVPWDDHIAAARAVIDTDALRPTTRRAHAALAGVVAASFAADPAARTRTEANR